MRGPYYPLIFSGASGGAQHAQTPSPLPLFNLSLPTQNPDGVEGPPGQGGGGREEREGSPLLPTPDLLLAGPRAG